MAKDKLTAESQGKTYRVTDVGQHVGPWVAPAAFTEHTFAALHPIPNSDAAKATIDPETYHADLLWRLSALGHIVEDPNAVPTQVTTGTLMPTANQAIRDSVAQDARTREVRAAAGQEDVAARAADNKPSAAPSTPPVVNAAVTGGPGKPAAPTTK